MNMASMAIEIHTFRSRFLKARPRNFEYSHKYFSGQAFDGFSHAVPPCVEFPDVDSGRAIIRLPGPGFPPALDIQGSCTLL